MSTRMQPALLNRFARLLYEQSANITPWERAPRRTREKYFVRAIVFVEIANEYAQSKAAQIVATRKMQEVSDDLGEE